MPATSNAKNSTSGLPATSWQRVTTRFLLECFRTGLGTLAQCQSKNRTLMLGQVQGKSATTQCHNLGMDHLFEEQAG